MKRCVRGLMGRGAGFREGNGGWLGKGEEKGSRCVWLNFGLNGKQVGNEK